ncbi:MAG TPA: GxxExxY protein [Verrucomicrobiae bacterium]
MDYEVMRCAFESQNELGRLCDEIIYRNDLAARLQAAGLIPVHKEVPITVKHRDFAKTYRMDLVVGNTGVYELKTEARLAVDHEAQLLNYLFLCGASHGKLVNFRPPQVESRFVNSMLNPGRRKQFDVDTRRWRDLDGGSLILRISLLEMLQDWGNSLELSLYTEAVIHFLGGEAKVAKVMELRRAEPRWGISASTSWVRTPHFA